MIPLRDINPNERPPLMTGALIIANLAGFWVELTSMHGHGERFFATFGLVPARFLPDAPASGTFPAVATFVTSMFLHGGWMHLIGNMWFLWLFGDNVEDRMGHGRFLVFYVLCGLAAGFAHVMLNLHSPMPSIGASGAISGVIGAYMILFPGARILTLVPIFMFFRLITVPAWLFIGFWAVLQFFGGFAQLADHGPASGGIAFWAHIGGFVAGIVLLAGFVRRRARRR